MKYHFIAIGGIGMSGLAKYLIEEGHEVSGSDICKSKYTDKIEKMGAKVFIGHDENNLPEECIVIASTAIKEDNPELMKAKRLGLKVYHRSDLLAEISNRAGFFIGYSGTHGKTTTSGMSSYVLEKAGFKPSFVVGGIIPDIETNAQSAKGKYFIAELDESDGTIVKYTPNVCVINNLEADHIDFYKDGMKSLLETFETYLSALPEDAKVLINNDCEGTALLKGREFITFGLNNADYTAKNIGGNKFDVYYKGEFLTDIELQLHGKHNIYNALAVLASLNEAGIDPFFVKEHFASFSGMGRRFQLSAEFDGICVYDDYAHHPTEIKATLSSLDGFIGKNLIAVFQPHRYSRLKSLWNDFLNVFGDVNKVIVTDVYAASEDPIDGINSEIFTKQLAAKGVDCEYLSGNMEKVAEKLYPQLKTNDIVIGLGAGTITALGKNLLKEKETSKVGN